MQDSETNPPHNAIGANPPSQKLRRVKDALVFAKMPPQAVELEAAVIGSCLNEGGRQVFEDVHSLITEPKVFYKEEHQKIYAAMQRLYFKGYAIDLLLVADELRKSNELEVVGGSYGLTVMCGSVVSDAYVDNYARVIHEKYAARELIRINGDGINKAYDDDGDIFELIEQTSEQYYELTSTSIQREPMGAEQVGMELTKKLEAQKDAADNLTGVDTGFSSLNALTNGWQKTDLTIIAARPSVGKTAFALATAHAALEAICPTLIFSLEMGRTQIAARMISSITGVPLSSIMRPREMSRQEWSKYYEGLKCYAEYPFYIDDTSAINLFDMRAKVRRMKMKYGIQMVIVDYLQLMSGVGNEGNREQEISRISRGLKALAKDFDVPVIALSQLSRGIENTAGEAKRDPRLSDLRESGAIEQDADNVLFITNPDADMLRADPKYFGKKLIHIAKGRNIGLGRVCLAFNPDTQRWAEPGLF